MPSPKDIDVIEKIVINTETAEMIIKVKVSGATWRKALEDAKVSIAQKRKVPGFREGKAPAFLSAKNIPEKSLYNEALHALRHLCEARAAHEIVKQKIKEKIVSEPKVLVTSLDAEGALLTFHFPIFPHFEMPQYKGLGIKIIPTTLDDQDVIVTTANMFANLLPPEEEEVSTIAFHDVININFAIWLSGEEENDKNTGSIDISIGTGMLIPEVEEKLLGMRVGHEEVFEITFPPYYPKIEFRNQKGSFKVKINKITRKGLPALTVEKIQEAGIKGVNSILELDQYIERVGLNAKIEFARFIFRRDFLNALLPQMDITFSEQQIFTSQKFLFERFLEGLKHNQISLQEYLRDSGATQDSIYDELRAEAIKALKTQAFMGRLVEDENLYITDHEREVFVDLLAKYQHITREEALSRFTKEYLDTALIDQKMMMHIIEANDKEGYERLYREDYFCIAKPNDDSPRTSLDAIHREGKTLFGLYTKKYNS